MRPHRKPNKINKLILLCFIAAGLSACGADITPDEYVARAIEQQSKGDVNSAVIELKNALQKAPRHQEARYLLGTLYLEQGALISAEKEFYRAIDYGVERSAVAVPLARTLLAQGKLQELLDSTEGLSFTSTYTQANVLALKGQAYLGLARLEAAGQLYDQSLLLDKENAEAKTGLAQLAIVENQDDVARQYITAVLKRTPDFAFAQSMLGLIERRANNLEAAEQAYRSAAQHPIYRSHSQLQLGFIFIQLKQFDKAEEMVVLLKQRIKGSPQLDYLEGFLVFNQQDFKTAKDLFDTLLAKEPNHLSGLFYGGSTNAYLGNFASAKNQLEQHLKANPGNVYAQTLLAQVELAEGNPAHAQHLILSVLERFPDDLMALNLLAGVSLSQGSTQVALSNLQKAAQAQPTSVETQIRLGNLLAEQGQVEASLLQLEKAYKLEPDNGRVIETLVRQYLNAGENAKAMALAEKHLALNPSRALPHALMGMVYMSLDDNKAAEKALQKALNIDPSATSVYNGLAALAIRGEELDTAEQHLRMALSHRPGNYQTVTNLVTLKTIQGKQADIASILEDAVEVEPRVEFLLRLGRIYLDGNEPQKTLDLLIDAQGSDNTQKANLLGLRAEALLAAEQYSDARQTLNELLALAPKTAIVHFYLAQAAQGLNERAEMREELNTATQLDASYLPAKMALARMAVDDRDMTVAQKWVAELEGEVEQDNADLTLIKAQLAELMNDLPAAITAYQRLFDRNPSGSALLPLTRAQWRNGDKGIALASLQSWAKAKPDERLVQHDLALRYLALQRNDDAIATYTTLIKNEPEDALALNNLASLLTASQPKSALDYAKRAHALFPEDPAAIDTLSGAMLANEDIVGAQRMIERALAKEPNNTAFLSRQEQIERVSGQR